MDTGDLFEKLTKAVSFLYAKDPIVPGVLISNLRNGDFYVSVQRFKNGGKVKTVVFKTYNGLLSSALLDAAKWVCSQDLEITNPLEDLNIHINEGKLERLYDDLLKKDNMPIPMPIPLVERHVDEDYRITCNET